MYQQSPQRPVSSPQNMLLNTNKHHEHMYDANRNNLVPYYYSETLTSCMPNNVYSMPNKNRHTLANYPQDDKFYHRKVSPKLKSSLNASPQLSQINFKSNTYKPQSFRPYSVLETTPKSPVESRQRPSSVVPSMSDQYRPASFFITDNEKSNEIPEWKARLQREMPKSFKSLDASLRQVCRLPNCKCSSILPAISPGRFSEVRTLPTVSEKSLTKVRNLSLPTLKLEELDKDENSNEPEAERDVLPVTNNPVSEQLLGYV